MAEHLSDWQSPCLPPPLGEADRGYIDLVRRASRRLSSPEVATDNISDALGAAAGVSVFNVDVPTASHRAGGQVVKQLVKRATAWYLRYLTDQMTNFSQAVLRSLGVLGQRAQAVDDRLEAMESRSADYDHRIASLAKAQERLARAYTELARSQADLARAQAELARARAVRAGA